MRMRTYDLVRYPVNAPEKYNRLEGKLICKATTGHKILEYLFDKAKLQEFVYCICYKEDNTYIVALTVGEYQWEKDKKELADKYITHRQSTYALEQKAKIFPLIK